MRRRACLAAAGATPFCYTDTAKTRCFRYSRAV
jgi:hypothetical protein